VGRALKEARLATIREFGEQAIVWATYMLYGDPGFAYVRTESAAQIPRAAAGGGSLFERAAAAPRFRGEDERPGAAGGDAPVPRRARGRRAALWIGALAAALLAVYGVGQFQRLRQIQQIDDLLERTEAEAGPSGPTGELAALYEQAMASPRATGGQRTSLHGRLAGALAARGELQAAALHYENALQGDPGNRGLRGSLCSVLHRMGRHAQARECFGALMNGDGDARLALTLNQGLEALLLQDQERWRTERTDVLLDQLIARKKEPGAGAAEPREQAWTSRPLPLALLEIRERAASPQAEGRTELVHAAALARLRDDPRVRVVDREVLEQVLRELKVGTGGLADGTYALQLGRLLPADILVLGNLFSLPSGTQVQLRLVETETTQITAAATLALAPDLSAEEAGARLAEGILQALRNAYPLRASVVSVDGAGGLVMDLGRDLGVAQGSLFLVLPEGATEPRFSYARARVTAVQENQAAAAIEESGGPVSAGCRLVEAVEQER